MTTRRGWITDVRGTRNIGQGHCALNQPDVSNTLLLLVSRSYIPIVLLVFTLVPRPGVYPAGEARPALRTGGIIPRPVTSVPAAWLLVVTVIIFCSAPLGNSLGCSYFAVGRRL